MSDPIRILQADDEFERALLSSAESDAGSNLALKRALAAFSTAALVSTGSVAASAASASGATLTALSVAKWAGIGALVGGLGMSAASVAVHNAGKTRSPAASAQVRVLATASPRSVERGPERQTSSPPALSPPLVEQPAEPPLSVPARAKVTPAPERAEGLEAELAELQPARSALNAQDPDKALLLLERFQQSFPRAALGPEASLLRLEALVESGQIESARRLSQRLLQSQSEGPYADRVRALLARTENTGQRNP
jgi:hypothetical protein